MFVTGASSAARAVTMTAAQRAPGATATSLARSAPLRTRTDAKPVVREETGDLAARIEAFTAATPLPGSGHYRVPNESDRTAMRSIWDSIRAGDLKAAATAAAAHSYEVVRYTDDVTGRKHVLLGEVRGADGTWRNGWGMYVFSPEAQSRAVIEVPHPWDDEHTDDLAVQLLRKSDAAVLAVAGASRWTAPGRDSDMAHASGTIFDTIHRAQLARGVPMLQLHGFRELIHPDYGQLVLSEGVKPRYAAIKLGDSLRKAGYDTRIYDGVNYPRLGARTNVQARSALAAEANFVHVEVGSALRYNPDSRARLAEDLAKALESLTSPRNP